MRFHAVFTFLVSFLLLCNWFETSAASCSGPQTIGELRDVLWVNSESNYDKRVRPNVAWLQANENNISPAMNPSSAAPDVIQTQLHILSIRSVEIRTGEFQVTVWLRQRWNDPRLTYATESQGGCFPDNRRQGFTQEDFADIWKPDLVTNNLINKKRFASSFWVYPNGDVVYVQSMLLTLSCQMEFERFPRDTQRCSLALGSWLEDASEVVLDFWDDRDPITLAEKGTFGSSVSDSSEWQLLDVEHDSNSNGGTYESHSATQDESVVYFTLILQRNSGHYVDFVVGPVLIIVVLSWASFFIERKSAPARVTMTIVCFLTNINFLSNQLSLLPRLSNEVWILKFLTQSMFFSFYAVIEYVVCNYLHRVEQRINKGRKIAMEYKLAHLHSKRLQEDLEKGLKKSLQRNTKFTVDASEMAEIDDGAVFQVNKEDFLASGFDYKVDTLLLTKKGKMLFKDEHVDITSRYMYPIIYVICFSVLWATG